MGSTALTAVAKRTAHRDLSELVEKGIFQKDGTTGKGAFYKFSKGTKRAIIGKTPAHDLNRPDISPANPPEEFLTKSTENNPLNFASF